MPSPCSQWEASCERSKLNTPHPKWVTAKPEQILDILLYLFLRPRGESTDVSWGKILSMALLNQLKAGMPRYHTRKIVFCCKIFSTILQLHDIQKDQVSWWTLRCLFKPNLNSKTPKDPPLVASWVLKPNQLAFLPARAPVSATSKLVEVSRHQLFLIQTCWFSL